MVMIDGKIEEAYYPGSEAPRMTTVMIVGGRADDAFYEMAHVWSVRPYRSRRFLRMTGANSIPTNIGRQTRLCLGISSNATPGGEASHTDDDRRERGGRGGEGMTRIRGEGSHMDHDVDDS